MSALALSLMLVEIMLYAIISGFVSNALSKSKSKRIFATPLLIIRLLYTDLCFCIVTGVLAVICNMFLPHDYHGCRDNGRYYHTLLVAVILVLLTRVWSSSYTIRLHTVMSRRTKHILVMYVVFIVVSCVLEHVMVSLNPLQLSYYLLHFITFTSILLYHNLVLEYLEDISSVKEHLLCKLLNSVSHDVKLPAAKIKPLPLRGNFKSTGTKAPSPNRSISEGSTNMERLERFSRSEELYDSVTLKLIVVCCLLCISLLVSELNVLSVYFLAIFLTTWFTLFMYCIQERSFLCFYIAIGKGKKFKHNRVIDKSVTFNKFIECLEFDDRSLSPTLTTKPTVFFHTLRKTKSF